MRKQSPLEEFKSSSPLLRMWLAEGGTLTDFAQNIVEIEEQRFCEWLLSCGLLSEPEEVTMQATCPMCSYIFYIRKGAVKR